MESLTNFFNSFINLLPQVVDGLKVTLLVFALTLIIAIPLGVILAMGRLSKNVLFKNLTGFYVLIMRGTPLLLQIVFIFFGLPLINVTFDRVTAVIIAFALNYAAYFAEIFRAGIGSIDNGQYHGAKVLGLSKKDTFFRIIFPQALKRVLPPVGNEIVTLIKDTALVYVVGLDDLLKIGKIASNRDSSLLPLFIIGLVYLLLIGILSKLMKKVEKKYDYYK